jgi:hypothetical protein
LVISGLTADSDSQTTKRRIALIGGSITEPMIIYLENNTATTLTYNQLDSALTIIESYFNNKKPPTGIKDMVVLDGRVFLVTGDNNLSYSLPLFYEAFPLSNYRNLADGEQFMQVAVVGSYIAARGKGREYLVQLTGSEPAYWQVTKGAKEGAVSSRFLIEDTEAGQVWASKKGFYASPGYYLPKINPVVADFSAVFGAMVGKKAYLAFEDTGGVSRIMRIDYTLNRPVAHYVENLEPTAVFADPIEGKVYYASGPNIYEFDAGSDPLPVTLTIPEQLCKVAGLKSFVGLYYELTGAALDLALSLDRAAIGGSISLPIRNRGEEIADFPEGTNGGQLGMTLTSTEDFVLYLPLELEQAAI